VGIPKTWFLLGGGNSRVWPYILGFPPPTSCTHGKAQDEHNDNLNIDRLWGIREDGVYAYSIRDLTPINLLVGVRSYMLKITPTLKD